MKLKILSISFLLLLCTLIAYSCGGEKGTLEENLKLEKSSLELQKGEKTSVKIISGNGNYQPKTSPTDIVMARVIGNEISITALKKGNTTLTVTDAKNKSASIAIEVKDPTPLPPSEREALIPGEYIPGPETTGIPAGVDMTNYNQSGTKETVAIPPGKYSRKHFYGDCYPSDPTGEYVFEECYFHGGVGHPGNNRGCFYCWSLTTGWATFTDCTIAADDPSYYRDGIVGHRFTVKRCNIYNVNDCVGGNRFGGGEVIANWLHDMVWWMNDPAHDDGTHNDCIQIQRGNPNTSWLIKGNLLECTVKQDSRSTGKNNSRPIGSSRPGWFFGGSALIVNYAGAPDQPRNVTITHNYFRYGYAQIQLNNGTDGYTATVKFGPNKYGREIYNNHASNPDYRWICLMPRSTKGGAISVEPLEWEKMQTFEDNNAQLTHGRTTGIQTL